MKDTKVQFDLLKAKSRLIEKKIVPKEDLKPFDRVAANRKARIVMDGIKDVMEINRQDFLEEFISNCQEKK